MTITRAITKRSPKVSLSDLCRVARGTPAGDWFRRYWLAVSVTGELRDIPRAVRVLGEALVLFRDEHGRIGLLGLHCPHRGSSLEYGDIENGGICCPYHGWLFDVSGQCFEQPAEPEGSKFLPKSKASVLSCSRTRWFDFGLHGPRPTDPAAITAV